MQITADKGSNGFKPQLSLPVLAGQVPENCLHADMKLPYPFSARHCFSLLLILLVMESRMATLIALDGLFSDVLRPNKK